MNRRFFGGLLGAIFSTALCAGTLVNNSDGPPQATGVADGYALVIFSEPPPAAWAAVGGVANAGAGIKIGVLDTGIDQTHPFLTDNTLAPPAGFPKFDPGNQQFTSKKVIVARVYFTGKPGSFT